jgi:hypothetical protein
MQTIAGNIQSNERLFGYATPASGTCQHVLIDPDFAVAYDQRSKGGVIDRARFQRNIALAALLQRRTPEIRTRDYG